MLVFFFQRWYHCENANTLIGAAILKSGHPYIWARYREPIIRKQKLVYHSLFTRLSKLEQRNFNVLGSILDMAHLIDLTAMSSECYMDSSIPNSINSTCLLLSLWDPEYCHHCCHCCHRHTQIQLINWGRQPSYPSATPCVVYKN